jgi:succinate dehydrogenase hydrophobic anchor subunit
LIALLLIVLSLIYHLLRDVGLRFPHSWREVITLKQDGVSIGLQGSSILSGKLSNTSVVFAYLVILVVMLDGHLFNTTRVIFRDALHPEAFREMCVYLKYSR